MKEYKVGDRVYLRFTGQWSRADVSCIGKVERVLPSGDIVVTDGRRPVKLHEGRNRAQEIEIVENPRLIEKFHIHRQWSTLASAVEEATRHRPDTRAEFNARLAELEAISRRWARENAEQVSSDISAGLAADRAQEAAR